MPYDKERYEEEFKRLSEQEGDRKYFIRKSEDDYKTRKYLKKGIESLELAHFISTTDKDAKDYWTITISYYAMLYAAKAAILTKGYETDDHYATQIALGHLLIPDKIEREDLELLEEAHKIFENDYVDYFEEVRKESNTSRYSATKRYTQRRMTDTLKKATAFVSKIEAMMR